MPGSRSMPSPWSRQARAAADRGDGGGRMALNSIEETYRARTAKSAELTARAKQSLPGGVTRNFGFHLPYPVVHERGEGPYLWDVDGNRYVDLNYNGLSLIHGHAYAPVVEGLAQAAANGWAWLGT